MLKVACAQLRPDRSIAQHLKAITGCIKDAAQANVDMVLFPECSVTGYGPQIEAAVTMRRIEIEEAHQHIQEVCRQSKVNAIVGTPYLCRETGRWHNSAVVVGSDGHLVGRQDKMQLVPPDEGWAHAGSILDAPLNLGLY